MNIFLQPLFVTKDLGHDVLSHIRDPLKVANIISHGLHDFLVFRIQDSNSKTTDSKVLGKTATDVDFVVIVVELGEGDHARAREDGESVDFITYDVERVLASKLQTNF